jgi:hypothetical protein
VRKIAVILLFAALGLTLPVAATAQSGNSDAARIASQKHNARRSNKAAKAQKRAMRKAIRKAGKQKKPQTMTYQTLN